MGKILTRERQPDQPPVEPEDDAASISVMLSHPLFLQLHESPFSAMIKPLQDSIQGIDNAIDLMAAKKTLNEALKLALPQHGDNEELTRKMFEKVNESNKTMCWRVLSANELYFRCLDCEVMEETSLVSVQCQECFAEANHEGHRVLKCKPQGPGYTCDCGALDVINLEGTCPTHMPKEQTVEEALADFPQEVRQKFTEIFKKVIYVIISVFEIEEKAKSKRIKGLIDRIAQEYLTVLMMFCKSLISNISKSFSLVIERILRSKFDESYNLVWHDCLDYTDEDFSKNGGIKPPSRCSCTLLGCLLRFAKYFNKNCQTNLEQMLTECFKDKKANEYLHREVCKHMYFLLADPSRKDNEIKMAHTTLAGLLRHEVYLGEDDLDLIDTLLGAAKRVLAHCDEMTQDKINGIHRVQSPLSSFLTNGSKASENALVQTGLMNELLGMLAGFQVISLYPHEMKLGLFEHNIEYDTFAIKLATERILISGVDHGLKTLSDMLAEVRDPIFKGIAKDWQGYFDKTKMVQDHQRLFKGLVNPHSGLEKTFCLMIIHYLQYNISKESLEGFLRKLFPEVYPSTLAANAVRGSLITLGLMRFADIAFTSDPNRYNYYHVFRSIYEMDIVFIQLMALFVNPQDLFSLFTRSFLSYSQELIDACLSFSIPQSIVDHPHSRQAILVLEDFLEFFIYIMNDELSLMNLNLREKVSRIRPGFPPERVIRKVFVNLLPDGKWANVGSIKEVANMFISKEIYTPVDSIISKIVVRDDKHQVKLKKEYESELDPYIFYKLYHFQKTRQNNLTSEEVKTQERDIVSGKFYTDLDPYLIDIQQNIFQSQLPDFVSHIIKNFSREISRLLQPALKLVLFNLQVLNAALEKPNNNTEELQKKAQANYLNSTFSKSLNEILGSGDYKESEPCIKNIQGLIKQLSSQVLARQQSVEQSSVEERKEDPIAEKKRLAKEKMEKLKEQFAQKQALFAQKNEDLLINKNAESPGANEQVLEDSPERNRLVCQYCLDKIDELSADEYGVPIFVEFTNNFYNTEEEIVFTEQDYTDLSKAKWWPVISSCNHFYHRGCFDKHCESARGPQNESSQFFNNELEVQCTLCKKLGNSFLVMNTDKPTSENSSERFMLGIQNLLALRKESLLTFEKAGAQDKSYSATLQEILHRGYEYFAESFHLYDQPSSLSENFDLYFRFFKACKNCPKEEASPEKKSFLNSVFDTKTQTDKVYPELVVNKLFFNLLLEKSNLPTSDENFAVKEYLQIIREYIILSLVHQASLGDTSVQLANVASLYRDNNELRSKAINELSFSMQKILLAYYLNKCVLTVSESPKSSELSRILCSEEDNFVKLDLLLKHVDIPLSFDQLVEESLSLIDTLSESEKDVLNSVLNPEASKPSIYKLKLTPQFQSENLPQTFMEYNQRFLRRKCDLCKQYNPRHLQSLCLICGKSLCAISCDPTKIQNPGLLSEHAGKCHMGLGLFLVIDLNLIIYIKWPLNLLYYAGPTYVNELGEWITDLFRKYNFDGPGVPKSLNFEQFVLSEKIPEKINKVIMRHSMGQEIFENAPTNNLFNDLRL